MIYNTIINTNGGITVAISENNKREYTTIPKETSNWLKEQAEKSGRKTVSNEIAYIIKIYKENKEKIDIIIK